MSEQVNAPQSSPLSRVAEWFQPYNDQLHRDPYPFYTYLLEQEPVHYIQEYGFWVVSRYEDVSRVLKEPLFVREMRTAMPEYQPPEAPPVWKPVNAMLDNWMLFRDAPAHTRLRGLVSHAFTPRTIERLKPEIQAIAELLADRMEENMEAELIGSYAFPLPVIVIAELLGVPAEDRELFKSWSHTFAGILEGGEKPPEFAEQAGTAVREISEYFRSLIAERKKAPREDMISGLLAAKEQADALTEAELIATCVLLLVAGHETTVNLIGNSVLALHQHPAQLDRLLKQPELINTAVEEVLRYESPVQMTSRLAGADCELGGVTIHRGQSVNVVLGAANRDPAQFSTPDQFDIGRTPNRHLAFAAGAHFCLGAPLARMEAEIALSVLLKRYPNMSLADSRVNWRPNILFRGPETLNVRL